jgi:biopolymer transport protein ExbD
MRRAQAGMGGEEEDNEINLTPMLDVVLSCSSSLS